ncbi:hypothetical protein BKA82DRAFT_10533 [Pisolithus tinctorius]|uniref:Uncharacterized protein n=1 Tax=Pisolithus tinctorius Marx 270 TaxID=870435 RepID=A0A0C3NBT5_PISTI|nr:hypothetical protein BKA82DRAFT_10533 [Pisolithus tinctorius]KIN98589.1 hypothetical protein M404DRAFT_10533 [Pisolithus tinctorius Marx 270]
MKRLRMEITSKYTLTFGGMFGRLYVIKDYSATRGVEKHLPQNGCDEGWMHHPVLEIQAQGLPGHNETIQAEFKPSSTLYSPSPVKVCVAPPLDIQQVFNDTSTFIHHPIIHPSFTSRACMVYPLALDRSQVPILRALASSCIVHDNLARAAPCYQSQFRIRELVAGDECSRRVVIADHTAKSSGRPMEDSMIHTNKLWARQRPDNIVPSYELCSIQFNMYFQNRSAKAIINHPGERCDFYRSGGVELKASILIFFLAPFSILLRYRETIVGASAAHRSNNASLLASLDTFGVSAALPSTPRVSGYQLRDQEHQSASADHLRVLTRYVPNPPHNQTQGLGLVSELESIGTLPRVRLKNYGKRAPMYYISLVAFVGVLKYSQSSMYRQSDDPMACHTTTRPIQMPHREEVGSYLEALVPNGVDAT